LIGGLLAAAGGGAIGTRLHMGKSVIAHLENVWADIGAQATTSTEIMINFWIHQTSSLNTL